MCKDYVYINLSNYVVEEKIEHLLSIISAFNLHR